jgi:hypothetical protein
MINNSGENGTLAWVFPHFVRHLRWITSSVTTVNYIVDTTLLKAFRQKYRGHVYGPSYNLRRVQ